jgi:hypothetical protein
MPETATSAMPEPTPLVSSPSTGTHSVTTTFAVDPTGGTAYATIAEVIEITGPGMNVQKTKFTNLGSPNATEEYKPGLIDPDVLTMKLNWTKAQYSTWLGQLRTPGMAWKITFPLVGAEITASTLTGKGFLTKLGLAIPDNDRITNDVEFAITGSPVFTAGS